MVVDDGNIQLDLDVPGNDGVNPDDAVTSEGIDIPPTDSLEVTPPVEGDTIRVMDVEFVVLGAETVTVTFTIPGKPDKVIEVNIFTCHCVVTKLLILIVIMMFKNNILCLFFRLQYLTQGFHIP